MAMDQAHDEAQMGFLDHLEELRRRLFISVAAVFAAAAVLFVKKDWVFDAVLFAHESRVVRHHCGLAVSAKMNAISPVVQSCKLERARPERVGVHVAAFVPHFPGVARSVPELVDTERAGGLQWIDIVLQFFG